jgi:hypothetical protein
VNVKILLSSVIGGVIITLVTGLISNTPPMWVGAVWYGYPLPWLIQHVVAPEHLPWHVNVLNLIADIVIWVVIVGVVLIVLARTRKPARK